ncbi:MAG: PAS domain S-box protein [Acetobacteraceae bacterium]|nr:PAS domain S-box protein [Acetobacteraceae bacterium]
MDRSTPPAPLALAESMLDAMPERVVAIGPDRCFLFANRAFREFVNRDAAQVVGHSLAEVIGAESAAVVDPFLTQCFGGAQVEWEGWVNFRHLQERYSRQRFLPMRNAEGGVAAVLIVAVNPAAPVSLPPRVVAPAAVGDVEVDFRMLRGALDGVPARTVIIGLDNCFLYCNRAFAEFFRCDPEEIVGRHASEVIGDVAWRTMEPWRPRLLAGQTIRNEGWIGYPGGKRVYIHQLVLPYFGADGVVQAFVSMTQDLTALRLREAELEEQAAALRGTEATYGAVLASALDAVIVIDVEGAVVEFNPAAETIFGHSRAAVLGRPIGEVIVPPALRERHRQGFARYVAGGAPQILGRRIEVEALRADGTVFPMELAVTEVRLPTRRLFTAHARDLTEQRRAAGEIERQRERIHQIEKLSAMGSLLAGVAHELNNPLAILLTQASLLKETARDGAVRSRAERLEAAAARAGRIVKSFLAMARQKPAQREPILLNEVVAAALEVTAYALRSAGIAVETQFDAALPPVEGDRDLIGQIAANLVINAQQALAEQPQPRRLMLTTYTRDGFAVLEVADNGSGVPEAIRARVFDPYFTTKAVGVGTGIGLSICRQVAEEHGGSISLEDRPGGGALFRVALPLMPGAVLPDRRATTADGAIRQPGWSVLVVDDEVDVGQSLVDILEFLGHRPELVTGPEEALARLDAGGRYDLIFADLRMPSMNGMELRHAMAARQPRLATRFVVMTGDLVAGPRLIERDGAGPAPPMLEKPFNPAEVRTLLERLAARRAE